ncbi:MAG: undecaprenyl-diphosphate phosphatase [Myxococcales bacterium]|jgi:undecaprenyl-diphosphatase|nr:undecaprenyl-diphosphate phosphatase [Myxococcales bacterium]
MNYLQAIVLGFVQGLTEFLPISSTAHLRIVPALLGWADPGAAFSAIIQIGTTTAVIAYFARDLWAIARDTALGIVRRKPFETANARLGWFIVLGTVPIGIAGVALKGFIEGPFRSLYVIAAAAIGLACLLLVSERLARHDRPIGELRLKDAIVIGVAQAFALIPGASRSGVTLTAGLFTGLTREAAARYSFLLSVPATLAAGVFELRHLAEETSPLQVGPLAVGTLVSFVFGIAAIAWMLKFLRTHTTMVFIVYRIALGILILGLVGAGCLMPFEGS